MKKIGFIIAAFLSSSFAFAQTAQFGIRAGANLANITSNQGTSSTARVGFHAGLLAHIHVAPSIAIQPEAVYSSQGFKYVYDAGGRYNGEHSVELDYVNIPILFQYMPGSGFRLETGPQLGILTR
ncbi:MAG: PorT family protein, partial [Chitinophagaceae bacterium]